MAIPAYRLKEVVIAVTNLRSLMSDLTDVQLKEAELTLGNALMSVNLEVYHRERERIEREVVASV